MNLNPVASAELHQAREVARRAMGERETYVRVVAILVRAIETGTEDGLLRVDGRLAVRKSAFDEVPKKYVVNCGPAKVSISDDPNAPPEDVMVVEVKDKPEAKRLVVANGVV